MEAETPVLLNKKPATEKRLQIGKQVFFAFQISIFARPFQSYLWLANPSHVIDDIKEQSGGNDLTYSRIPEALSPPWHRVSKTNNWVGYPTKFGFCHNSF